MALGARFAWTERDLLDEIVPRLVLVETRADDRDIGRRLDRRLLGSGQRNPEEG